MFKLYYVIKKTRQVPTGSGLRSSSKTLTGSVRSNLYLIRQCHQLVTRGRQGTRERDRKGAAVRGQVASARSWDQTKSTRSTHTPLASWMRTSPQGKLRQRHSLPDRWSIAHYGRELACIHGDQDDVYGKFCVADSPSSSLSTKVCVSLRSGLSISDRRQLVTHH